MSYLITPKFTESKNMRFLWNFNPSIDSNAIDLTLSYLYIPENYTLPGVTYRLTLKMTNELNYSVSAYTSFTRTSPPICGEFTASLSNTQWVLEGVGCYASQNSLFSYQYGFQDQSGLITWLTLLTYTTPITLRIPTSATFAVMKVSNKYQASQIYYYNITGANQRKLDLISDFKLDIQDSDQIPSSIIYYTPLANNRATLSYIYDTTYAYFTTQVIDQYALISYLDCAKAVLSSPYIDKSLSTNVTNLIYSLTNAYNNTLLNSQISKILDIVSSAAELIDKFSIINLIKLLGINFRTNTNPGLSYNYTSSKLVFYQSRLFWHNLPSLAINLNTIKLLLPSDLQLEASDVFDLSFAYFSAEVFYLNITKSGTYQNYSLNLLSQNQDSIVSVSSYISLIIFGSFSSSSGYQCLELKHGNWETGNCSVYQVNSENITLHFKSYSVYFVTLDTVLNCHQGFGPIATMNFFIFLMIVLSLIFFIKDKVVKEVPVLIFKPLLVYPLTGLFFKQPNPLRVALVTQLLTCELLILALIGASYQYFDNPTQPNNFTFADYYLSQMFRGAAA